MKKIRKIARITSIVLILILITAFVVIYPMLKAACGYSAKLMCSGVFIEGMSKERVQQMELTAFPFNKVSIEVDLSGQKVKSSILGLVSQEAIFEKGKGVVLYLDGYKETAGREVVHLGNNEEYTAFEVLANDCTLINCDVEGIRKYVEDQFNETSKAVLIIKDGKIIAEKYAEGITENTPLLGWSMTKSLTNALVGILVKKEVIDIYKPAPIKEWSNDDRKNITMHNLLQMSSGLMWNEDYSKTKLSDVSRMLYVESDVYSYANDQEVEFKPDSVWEYSSGTTNIISGLLRSYFDKYEDYYQFPQKELFDKLGMNSSLIETDASGNFIGSSYGYCSARDWAKFGMLYLNNGIWNGEQILPDGWVKYTRTPAKKSEGKYGAQFWLNSSGYFFPDLPRNVYFAKGYRGQIIAIFPDKNMIVVCLNSSPQRIDFNRYLGGIVKFVE